MGFPYLGAILASSVLFAAAGMSWAQTVPPTSTFGAAQEIPLYPGIAPGSEGRNYTERTIQGKAGPQVFNVVRPTLLYISRAARSWHSDDCRAGRR
jgi:hypothetical protein